MIAVAISLWLLAPQAAPRADVSPVPRLAVVEIRGVRVEYFDWGGAGEPLVLVPSRCDTPFVFGDLAPLLVSRFRVLGITARGCSGSGQVSDGYSLDDQIRELVDFLDALRIERATFAGHSASGGKVVRLARQFPTRVARIVTLDIIYSWVPDEFEKMFQAAIGSAGSPGLSIESYRQEFRAWELGAWSPSLERDFLERTETAADGTIRFRRQPPEWQQSFLEDLRVGRYFETAVACPALFLVANDLDLQRVKRLPGTHRRQLEPLARAITRRRSEQLTAYQQNGPHVQVVLFERASHYLFVDRARDVASRILQFLDMTSR